MRKRQLPRHFLSGPDSAGPADKAHEVCPYSNATRVNIDVKVSVVED